MSEEKHWIWDGTIWEKNTRDTKARMAGLWQAMLEIAIGATGDEVRGRTDWSLIVFSAGTRQLSGSG